MRTGFGHDGFRGEMHVLVNYGCAEYNFQDFAIENAAME